MLTTRVDLALAVAPIASDHCMEEDHAIAALLLPSSLVAGTSARRRPCRICNRWETQKGCIGPRGKRVLGQNQRLTMERDSALIETLRESADQSDGKGVRW